MSAPFSFALPPELSAQAPAERRGIARDAVRLLIIHRDSFEVEHSRFDRLGTFLRPDDLLVFNSSRTLPAILNGCAIPNGPCLQVRLAQRLPDDTWLALLLCQRSNSFDCGLQSGLELKFGQNLTATVGDRDPNIPRLWQLRFSQSGTALMNLLYRLGQPIRYEYVAAPWDLDDYQTVYAKEPGSAEMPSAGRAFTWKLLFDLKRRGIETTDIVLHTGLSSYMDDELDARHPVSEEAYFISEAAAKKINQTRQAKGRIIAVGTTVVRALESASDGQGQIKPGQGYTRLHITADRALQTVDGLLTGLHEPQASHLDLLAAFLPPAIIQSAYTQAIQQGYLWHEFGDLNLIF
ncbi:S-adenosylmethionine:tRNA ribosyltransferase-isomerase [Pleurocapsales cyanobacterium LEGE 06147]|nr:S-adenosylmethionine:tRNA ribosyltransferase-isomerase [Pleurocapsales cyanobacterium LEGE 06147]